MSQSAQVVALTNYVVSELVPNELLHWCISILINGTDKCNNLLTVFEASILETSLDHITSIFVHRINHDLRINHVAQFSTVLQVAMFDDVLNNVVAILVYDKLSSASVHLA